jgi:gamma-butyrobetaine dioxygenase
MLKMLRMYRDPLSGGFSPDNTSYTPQNLGLHMDLLYFANPPTIQLLHCLRNSVTGGSSIFTDSFHAATRVRLGTPSLFSNLATFPVTFHYQNAGEHYHYTRPTVELEEYSYRASRRIININWSPPFQAPFEADIESPRLRAYLSSAKAFAKFIEAPESQFELILKPGECVIFNNRRVLHARRAFDPSSGERWLKGAYIDGDPFQSRLRVLSERYSRAADGVDAEE